LKEEQRQRVATPSVAFPILAGSVPNPIKNLKKTFFPFIIVYL